MAFLKPVDAVWTSVTSAGLRRASGGKGSIDPLASRECWCVCVGPCTFKVK